MDAGAAVRRARRAKGLTQRQLAVRTGISQPGIARIESGRITPRVDTLDRLLAACGVALQVHPAAGTSVDRTQIRELLRLTPDERIQLLETSSRNLAELLAEIRSR